MTTTDQTADPMKLARDALDAALFDLRRDDDERRSVPIVTRALAAIDALPASAQAVAWHMRVIGCDGSADWLEIGAAHPETPQGVEALPLVYAPASVPSGEPAATLYVEVRECPDCQHVGINDDDGTAACTHCDWHGPSPAEDHCPGCGSNGTMTTACPECGHRTTLMASARLPIGAAAPTAQALRATAPAAPAPAPLPDAQALQQARWEGIQSAQVQTAEIVRAAIELLDSVGEGLPPDALAAFKRVFGGAAPAVAAPEAPKPERTPFTQAQLRRLYDNSPEIGNDVRSRYAFYRVAMLVEAAHGITAPTTQEQQ